jgi:hypothetical protein
MRLLSCRQWLESFRDGESGDAPRTPSPNFENVAELVQRTRA